MGLTTARGVKAVEAAVRQSRKAHGTSPAPAPAARLRSVRKLHGRPVYSAAQLACMTPEELARIGLALPPEPEWQEEWDAWEKARKAGLGPERRQVR
jgi:hypothetical protein